MEGTSELGINLWPAIAVAIGWVYLLVFQELHRRKGGDAPLAPAPTTPKALDELRSPASREPGPAELAFDEALFLQQAGAAYEFILTRYAAGDMEGLSGLLDAEVFEAFSAETVRRASAGETLALEFVALESCEIVDKEFDEAEATIRVRFGSELFLSEGQEATGGDTTATTLLRAVDIWTFRRERLSRSPIWTLAATDSE
jgi:predicted lipid-binding transport protein (Tim44 family)